jgi:hypothetical protein
MDRKLEILLAALRQALGRPQEQRLFKAGKLDGLFPSRAGVAAEAAEQALREGLLQVVRTETKGKVALDWVRPTPLGVEFLHKYESPVQVLHDLRQTLQTNQRAIPLWLEDVRAGLRGMEESLAATATKWVEKLEELTRRVDDTLRRLEAASPLVPRELLEGLPWSIDAINYLDRRRNGGATDPCPLPELFAALSGTHFALTIPAYHAGLRKLHERRVLRLQPTSGDITQPEFALLEAGTVMYVAVR